MKKSLDNKAGARLIYIKEEFQSDGSSENRGNAFIEVGETWVTMKDSSRSSRDAVITSTQQPDVSLVKTETMHFSQASYTALKAMFGVLCGSI